MLEFGETKIAKEEFYAAKKSINVRDVNIDKIVISKSVKTKTDCMYFIGYSDKYIRSLVLTMSKRGLYVPENDIECEYLQSFLSITHLYMKINITCKYI